MRVLFLYLSISIIPLFTNSSCLSDKDKYRIVEMKRHTINDFIDLLARKESSCNWKVVNRFGYVGKYQFGLAARATVGVKYFTSKDFRENPWIWTEEEQDSAAIKLLKWNHRYISKYLMDYHFKYIYRLDKDSRWYMCGEKLKLNWAAIYAACHLVGPGNVRKFLKSNGKINPKDGNGVTCFDYMKYFSQLNIKSII